MTQRDASEILRNSHSPAVDGEDAGVDGGKGNEETPRTNGKRNRTPPRMLPKSPEVAVKEKSALVIESSSDDDEPIVKRAKDFKHVEPVETKAVKLDAHVLDEAIFNLISFPKERFYRLAIN